MYAEDLEQIRAGSVVFASVFVKQDVLCLVDYFGHVLMLYLNPLAPTVLRPHPSAFFL